MADEKFCKSPYFIDNCNWSKLQVSNISGSSCLTEKGKTVQLTKNSTIALYSSSNSLELFYLCKVIDFCAAIENMVDEYKHIIPQGSPYIECQYYQKQKETKSKICYIQVTPKKVCLLDTGFITISQFN